MPLAARLRSPGTTACPFPRVLAVFNWYRGSCQASLAGLLPDAPGIRCHRLQQAQGFVPGCWLSVGQCGSIVSAPKPVSKDASEQSGGRRASRRRLAGDPLPSPGPQWTHGIWERVSGRILAGHPAPAAPAAFEVSSHLTSLPTGGYQGGGLREHHDDRQVPEMSQRFAGASPAIKFAHVPCQEHPRSYPPPTLLQIQELGITVTAPETLPTPWQRLPRDTHAGPAAGA